MLTFLVDLFIAMLLVSGLLLGIGLAIAEAMEEKKMRLIDADKLMENKFKNDISYNAFCNLVKRQPSIDAVKHGRWIPVGDVDADGNQYYSCSECGCGERHVPIVEVKFCWNCGARMDGEENG